MAWRWLWIVVYMFPLFAQYLRASSPPPVHFRFATLDLLRTFIVGLGVVAVYPLAAWGCWVCVLASGFGGAGAGNRFSRFCFASQSLPHMAGDSTRSHYSG